VLASAPERSKRESLVAAFGVSVKVSSLKMVRMSPEGTLPVTTVLTGTSVAPSAGVMETAPAGAAASTIVTLCVPVTPLRLAVTVTTWFPVTAEAVSKPPLLIVVAVEFSLHVGVIARVVPLSHVPVAVYVAVAVLSFTDVGPLTAMLINVADGGGGGGGAAATVMVMGAALTSPWLPGNPAPLFAVFPYQAAA